MEQKKYKRFTLREIRLQVGLRSASWILLLVFIPIAFHLGPLSRRDGINFLERWIPAFLLVWATIFVVGRNLVFLQRRYIKFKIESIKFDRERFNCGKGPEDLQDQVKFDVPIQSLEKLLAELPVRPRASANELSPIIMEHDFGVEGQHSNAISQKGRGPIMEPIPFSGEEKVSTHGPVAGFAE